MSDVKQAFREVMSRWATGVTVVGAGHDGRYVGLVASSFTSVSADPPTILICVDLRSRSLDAILSSEAFSVNVLRNDQQTAFRVFAGMEGSIEDKFEASGEAVEPSAKPISIAPTPSPTLLARVPPTTIFPTRTDSHV